MTDALDTLRPEVAEAVKGADAAFRHEGLFAEPYWQTIRAELLRLASDDCGLHEALCEHDELCDQFTAMRLRAERAEAELAALKARIADAPEAYLTSRTGIGPCNIASLAHGAVFDSSSYGKSVRLVVED